MTEVPFHATRMGRQFYEHTLPELVRQLQRLNEVLGRLAEALEMRGPTSPVAEAEEQGGRAPEVCPER